jgi:hypothetical protein
VIISRNVRRILGAAALFSGAALVAHVLSGISLRLTLAFTAFLLLLAIALVARRAAPASRGAIRRQLLTGVLAGIAATVTYDAAKFALSYGTISVFNPFEATHAFGVLLAGPSAPDATILAAGIAFHALNGISFGVAFCFLFHRRSLLQGIGWGLFLELFQVTLFPGWLDIRAYQEFVRISGLAHLVYGATLSVVARLAMGRPSS